MRKDIQSEWIFWCIPGAKIVYTSSRLKHLQSLIHVGARGKSIDILPASLCLFICGVQAVFLLHHFFLYIKRIFISNSILSNLRLMSCCSPLPFSKYLWYNHKNRLWFSSNQSNSPNDWAFLWNLCSGSPELPLLFPITCWSAKDLGPLYRQGLDLCSLFAPCFVLSKWQDNAGLFLLSERS